MGDTGGHDRRRARDDATDRHQHRHRGVVEHSYYEEWSGQHFSTDPNGNPISRYHPWNKRTLPKPSAKSWKDKYTWSCAPRWDRQVMEAGAYARLIIAGTACKHPHSDFFEATR